MSYLIISIGTLSLNLTKFSSRDYRKLKTICQVSPTNIGGSRITAVIYPVKYTFDIETNLLPSQKETLDLIVSEHSRRISEKLANPEILLQDRQNPIAETVTTPSRLLADTTAITTLPVGIKYYPKFKCGITEYSTRELTSSFNCKLAMEEL